MGQGGTHGGGDGQEGGGLHQRCGVWCRGHGFFCSSMTCWLCKCFVGGGSVVVLGVVGFVGA